tara:strand:- start:4100 stop:4321 length:222 start_codon:yes stop_codon:yes gene_type:complete
LKKNTKKSSDSFEVEFEKLKSIVSEIEATEHNIEKMIVLFEEGMKLSESCERKIEDYKNKIHTIIAENKKESS